MGRGSTPRQWRDSQTRTDRWVIHVSTSGYIDGVPQCLDKAWGLLVWLAFTPWDRCAYRQVPPHSQMISTKPCTAKTLKHYRFSVWLASRHFPTPPPFTSPLPSSSLATTGVGLHRVEPAAIEQQIHKCFQALLPLPPHFDGRPVALALCGRGGGVSERQLPCGGGSAGGADCPDPSTGTAHQANHQAQVRR